MVSQTCRYFEKTFAQAEIVTVDFLPHISTKKDRPSLAQSTASTSPTFAKWMPPAIKD